MAATPPHRAASWIALGLSALAALMGAGAIALDRWFAARRVPVHHHQRHTGGVTGKPETVIAR